MRRNVLVGLASLLVVLLLSLPWWRPGAKQPPSPPKRSDSVRGIVVGDDERPIAGARVRWKGTGSFVITGDDGRFLLPPRPKVDAIVTAAKPGYLIAGAAPEDVDLRLTLAPLTEPDNPHYAWVDPTPDETREHNCGNCHVEIYEEWRHSSHAHSARGERLLQLYASAHESGSPFNWSLVDEYPEGLGVCASCHAPSVDPLDPREHDLRHLKGVAVHGVHCDFCHKIEDALEQHAGLNHGTFGLQLRRPAEGQLFFGPLDDVDRGEDAFAPVHQESRICASCHEGIVFGVPVYTTYSEWLGSPARQAGKQCQTCHMAPTQTMHNIAPGSGGIERDPSSLASHRMFPGGKQAMLGKSLTLESTMRREGDASLVEVSILASNVGHRVPTGFIDRHLILVVQATDANDLPVALLEGPKLPSAAGAGLHDEPGQLFARLLTDTDGRAPAPFWRSGVTLKDSRLMPEQANVSSYAFPPTAIKARVRLLYRDFWIQVTTAKEWEDDTLTLVDRMVEIPRQ